MEVQKGQTYQHYKNGKTYTVLAIGRDEKTLEKVVVYKANYDDEQFGQQAVWVRLYAVFTEEVEFNGAKTSRFKLIA